MATAEVSAVTNRKRPKPAAATKTMAIGKKTC
jgi:hypothetical protein